MNVIVLAGGELTSEDPLFTLLPEGARPSKAHLELGGKPMLQWVLDALGSSQFISDVIVVGQGEDSGFTCEKPTKYFPDQGSLLDNVLAGISVSMESSPGATHTLLASGDIPLLTPEIVDWVVDNGLRSGADLV